MDLDPYEIKAEFGARVRRQRTQRGMSQADLARATGLHHTYISSVERGLRNISLLNIRRLAYALGVDPADLVEEKP